MNLKTVTITGADDSVSPAALADLSAAYPYVEWGILVSDRQEGNARFPTRHWIDRLSHMVERNEMKVSTHVCGRWVRELLVGNLVWSGLPSCIGVCRRIQINTHAAQHISTVAMNLNLSLLPKKEFIFQWDGVNDHLAFGACAAGLKVSALYDTSHGAGVLPSSPWPKQRDEFWCGYAGGLGPDNVVDQLSKIAAVTRNYSFWIDMERNVRSADDQKLDLVKVESVLKQVEPLVSPDARRAA